VSDSTRHPLFARLYATGGKEPEAQLACRRELPAGIGGRVLELGAGDGRNFALYPPGVEEVVAVEPEPYMRRRAQKRADSARVPVRLVDAVADTLPVADGRAGSPRAPARM
jgi:ubiquinone/menaquinone biosynthesis C-methylase UbiE